MKSKTFAPQKTPLSIKTISQTGGKTFKLDCGTSGKEPACQCGRCNRRGFDPWVGKIPCRRAWQPTPVFLPGESHGQRSLTGYSPQGHKETDMTEVTQHIAHKQFIPRTYKELNKTNRTIKNLLEIRMNISTKKIQLNNMKMC